MDAIGRAWLSLDGLSVGDAFGEQFFVAPVESFGANLAARCLARVLALYRRYRNGIVHRGGPERTRKD